MKIERVSIVGLGALGILVAKLLSERISRDSLCVVADEERIERYTRDGVYYNGSPCNFRYEVSGAIPQTADDLIIIGVKFGGLDAAIEAIRARVGPSTQIISMINGIYSEEVLSDAFGAEHVIPCVAQGMSAVRTGTRLECGNIGQLVIGEAEPGLVSERVESVSEFLTRGGVPHLVHPEMMHHMWGKLMTNVGTNQVLAVLRGTYAATKKPGNARDMLVSAMREVMDVSVPAGVNLTEKDFEYWLSLLDGLPDDGKPSMCQDIEAGRRTEVELFAGTIIRLGKTYGVPTPVNQQLYDEIKKMEADFA